MDKFETEIQKYQFTAEGFETLTAVMVEFCHGFTLEEIANNNDIVKAEDIKVMVMMLLNGYANAYLNGPVEN